MPKYSKMHGRLWPLILIVFLAPPASANGLQRTIWACTVPCVDKASRHPLLSVQVAYCSVTALSAGMVERFSSVCQAQNGRADAVASRSEAFAYADCVSSGNACPTEGPVAAGFTCLIECPSQDRFAHKFTACAVSSAEAWSYRAEVCADAAPLPQNFRMRLDDCTADGQSPCQ